MAINEVIVGIMNLQQTFTIDNFTVDLHCESKKKELIVIGDELL